MKFKLNLSSFFVKSKKILYFMTSNCLKKMISKIQYIYLFIEKIKVHCKLMKIINYDKCELF